MILTNTKTTGYSLGLPLWWPDNATQVSTGWLQGITLTLKGDPRPVFLTKYYRKDRQLSLTIADKDELLCSLNITLGSGPKSYPLQAESTNNFISGAITFYNLTAETEVDLTGAQICPKYITFIKEAAQTRPVFTLANISDDGKIVEETAQLSELDVESSNTITVTGSTELTLTAVETPILSITPAGQNILRTINGSISANLIFPDNWVIRVISDSCIAVGVVSDVSSCPDSDIISQRLNPGNYTRSCPLDLAFVDDAGNPTNTFNLKKIVCRRYNTEYEISSKGGAGLEWSEFSELHDDLT